MRVGIIGLQHESNTFQSAPTTWEHFEQGALLTGQAIVRVGQIEPIMNEVAAAAVGPVRIAVVALGAGQRVRQHEWQGDVRVGCRPGM